MSERAPPSSPVVTRLAPSPTGLLHLGHARSFLLAWWHARSSGGRVVLRIEDLDRERCKPELVDTCLRDLEWLGLDWDGPPVVQSRDTSPYERACAELLAAGLAYSCVCTRAEIAALSAPHAGDSEQRYPGTCRGKWTTLEAARSSSGRAAGIRFEVANGPQLVRDELHGERAFDVQREVGDVLVQRRDGAFAYQLAVVVDDSRQGITDVVRGSDLWSSAARQLLLQRALGFAHPRWWHVPLVVDEGGERLAKRRGDVALAELRAQRVDARAVVAWAAASSGQPAEPRCTAREVCARFDLRACPRTALVLSAATLAGLRAATQ
ncbi:MAG: tRNA glutamyl-Q(34) synthetase GluQRS [Planctomycetes bacterium]|nr:tRNA glutamyl-Q(34) synthetase GluQRS [Planctomycetota bacterium]